MVRLEITEAFIRQLAGSTPANRRKIFRKSSNEQLKGLCEVALNIIRGNAPMNSDQYRQMKRHRSVLEALSNRRLALYKKREIVNQKGGFLGHIAAFALPLLAHLLTKARK